MSPSPTSTVIVARTAHQGRERQAQAWLEEIVQLAAETPGYVRGDIQPPGPDHPDEWVVVYEFANSEQLATWLTSRERQAMVTAEPDLFEGAPREQVIATRYLDESITAVASFRLRPFDNNVEAALLDAATVEDAFATEYENLVATVSQFPGFVRCELFEAVPGVQDETIVVFTFEARTDLDAWLESPERQDVLARIKPLFASDRTMNIVGGFAGWFGNAPDRPVRTWKQAALILLALYPTALAIGALRDVVAPGLPGPIATLIGNAGGVIVLTWWLMPELTNRFSEWLRR